jgi:hypothetical protein
MRHLGIILISAGAGIESFGAVALPWRRHEKTGVCAGAGFFG